MLGTAYQRAVEVSKQGRIHVCDVYYDDLEVNRTPSFGYLLLHVSNWDRYLTLSSDGRSSPPWSIQDHPLEESHVSCPGEEKGTVSRTVEQPSLPCSPSASTLPEDWRPGVVEETGPDVDSHTPSQAQSSIVPVRSCSSIRPCGRPFNQEF